MHLYSNRAHRGTYAYIPLERLERLVDPFLSRSHCCCTVRNVSQLCSYLWKLQMSTYNWHYFSDIWYFSTKMDKIFKKSSGTNRFEFLLNSAFTRFFVLCYTFVNADLFLNFLSFQCRYLISVKKWRQMTSFVCGFLNRNSTVLPPTTGCSSLKFDFVIVFMNACMLRY